MPTLPSRAHLRALLALAAFAGAVPAIAIGAAEAAATDTRSVHLRVEGRAGTVEPGRGYVAGTVRTQRAVRPDCRNRRGRPRFPGPTPVGALGLAGQHNDRLRPLRMQLTDFGWQLCQVGAGPRQKSFGTFPGDFGGWLYRVNHEPGFAAMDEATLRVGDNLLVYYAIFPGERSQTEPLNNGRELVLRRVPARTAPGQPFWVRVIAFDAAGEAETVMPGEQIEVRGGDRPARPDGSGFARVTISSPGISRLRAVHVRARRGEFGPERDIPSEAVAVCARHDPRNCPRLRGTLIRGSPRADRIRGTAGDDVIRAGPGDDVINLRPGGRNRVFCGRGRDTVIINRGERRRNTFRNCQRIVAR
jgi:hypothetical protein